GVAPALLRVENGPLPNFAVVLKSSRRLVSLLTPDLHVLDVPAEQLRDNLCAHLESPLIAGIEDFLTEMGVDDNRRTSARRELLRHRLGSRYLGGCWSLRSAPGANSWGQAREAG